MANVEIKVDTTHAIAKFDRIPVAVRDNLRAVIPDLTRALGRLVNAKLDSELKSRNRLNVTEEMHENPNYIYGIVGLVGGPPEFLPNIIETGAQPHPIEGNPILAFFWEKLGQQVFFRHVNHPGFKGIRAMERSLDEMRGEIVAKITETTHATAQGVK